MSGRQRIIVPSRPVNGGFDFKFETDPYDVNLYGIMTGEDYTDAILKLNDFLRPSRSTKLDGVLLGTGMLILPLALWGVRHNQQVKRRRKLLRQGIDDFNRANPGLYMRYNKRASSFLSIERRAVRVETLPEATAKLMPVQNAEDHDVL